MNKTIKVTGSAKLQVRPDLYIINITLENVIKDYNKLLEDSNTKVKELRNKLLEQGFVSNNLKTRNFDIRTKYESYKYKDTYKQRFKGYSYLHEMKLEFALNNELLSKALQAITDSEVNPEFEINYSIKDENEARNELLEKAIKDARNKAEIIAEASDLRIKGIQNIDYSFTKINIEENFMDYRIDKCECLGKAGFDIDPDDIKLDDCVTIYYEVEKKTC